MKAKSLLDNMFFFLSRTREGQIWCCWFFCFSFGVILSEHNSSKDQGCHMHFTWLPYTVAGLFPNHLWIMSLQLFWCCQEGNGCPSPLPYFPHWESTGMEFGLELIALGTFMRSEIQLFWSLRYLLSRGEKKKKSDQPKISVLMHI